MSTCTGIKASITSLPYFQKKLRQPSVLLSERSWLLSVQGSFRIWGGGGGKRLPWAQTNHASKQVADECRNGHSGVQNLHKGASPVKACIALTLCLPPNTVNDPIKPGTFACIQQALLSVVYDNISPKLLQHVFD